MLGENEPPTPSIFAIVRSLQLHTSSSFSINFSNCTRFSSHSEVSSKMFAQARQSAASVFRRLPVAAVPIWAPFVCIATIALIPVIFFHISTPPSPSNAPPVNPQILGHGNPNFPESELNSSTLMALAEFDAEADSLRAEISTLLEDNFVDIDGPNQFHPPAYLRILGQARRLLRWWSSRRLQNSTTPPPDEILSDLPGFIARRKKYSSCAVVGNSGILLDADHGAAIDSHEAVIRLKNAPIDGMSRHVGNKTTISFINSNVLRPCYYRQRACFCHPYGTTVPIALYICRPSHLLDVAACNSTGATGAGNVFVNDPVFDLLCAKIAKYYSYKRWCAGGRRNLSDWSIAHEGEEFFHYSSGMQAVVMAVGVCERVNLYGFGKSAMSKHHYHTSKKAELKIHDYEAEYEFYRDLSVSPERIPFLSSAAGKFKFPPMVIHGPVVRMRKTEM